MTRCSRRVAARSTACALLCLCALRGGVRKGQEGIGGPQLELYVDLSLHQAKGRIGSVPSVASSLRRAPATAVLAASAADTTEAVAGPSATRSAPAERPVPLLVGQRKLSMVLPIGPAVGTSVHGDHGRLGVLIRSLAKFFVLDDLDTLLIVTPDEEPVLNLLAEIAKLASSPSVDAFLKKTVVVGDRKLAPEVYDREARGLNHVSGYTKQQIMKLAAAARVRTEWYLTLDADVICVRRTGFDDLIRNGRALVNMTPLGRHRDWHEDADRLLGTWLSHEHNDEQLTLGVTPSLLHTESVRQLGARLEMQHPTVRGTWREVLASHASPSWHAEHEPGRWVGEYALYVHFCLIVLTSSNRLTRCLDNERRYFTFLWLQGEGHLSQRFDQLYDRKAKDHVYLSQGYSVWSMENFEYFDPRRAFGKAAGGKPPPGYFIVVQSRSGVTPEEIAEKVSPYLKLEDGSDIIIGPDACGCEAGYGWSLSTGVGCCKKGSVTQVAELESCKQNLGNTNCLHGPDGHARTNIFGSEIAAIQLDPETKLPVGSYSQSCRGCVYEAPMLSCDVCQDGQKGCRGDKYNGCTAPAKVTVDLTGCDAGKIENEHGQLEIYCPGGGGHRGMPGG